MIVPQLNVSIYDINVGYTAKLEGYTNLSSDITKLSEIASGGLKCINYQTYYGGGSDEYEY